MIIPTAEFDPMFADDGVPFGIKMRHYIQKEFMRELGPYRALVNSEEGLAVVAAALFPQAASKSSRADAA